MRLLEEALALFPGCVLAVSHDRYFLNRIATGILSFSADGELFYTPGDYDYSLEKRLEREAAAVGAAIPVPVKKTPVPVKAKPKKLSYKEQKELDGMEEAIIAAEEKVSELEALIAPKFGPPISIPEWNERVLNTG